MTELLILSQPGCPNCAKAKLLIEKIKPRFPGLVVKEINILEQPAFVEKFGLLAAPGIVVNGKLEFTGRIDEKKLVKLLK